MQEKEILDIFDTYSDMVYRLALSYLRSTHDAEDVVQAVFLKIIEGKAKPEASKERAFLTQITINHCKDILRSSWRRKNLSLDETIIFEQKESQEVFHSIMALPEKYRITIYLHYYEGYSFCEIASFLRVSASAVSMRLHRARKILKQKLGDDYYEE